MGAGDLATGALAGGRLGLAVLWAALVGAFFKFVLTEGLARWQLATGETLLEGAVLRFGPALAWGFAVYLAVWSFQVGAALIGACGVAAVALVPAFEDPARGVLVFGALHSLAALGLVWAGGFRLFERLMTAAVGIMFVLVVATVLRAGPDWGAVAAGLTLPRVPAGEGGLAWTVALMGGVGGTLTILCYGYWIREEDREGSGWLGVCRLDLATAYAVTALFSVCMVILGSATPVEGGGATLLIDLGESLRATLGPEARIAFLVGAWAAVFSSLLGVWQATPYLFADFWRLVRRRREASRPPATSRPPAPAADPTARIDTRGRLYRGYLLALATLPVLGVVRPFAEVQRAYAVFGALVMPGLAALLLVMNGRRAWVGERTNRPWTVLVLVAVLVFFAAAGAREAWPVVRDAGAALLAAGH